MSRKVKAILPKKFNKNALADALVDEMNAFVDDIYDDFWDTVQTWKTKVKFSKRVILKTPLTGIVDTNNEIYGYVNFGTDPHPIPKVGTANLRFRTGYTAKTKPGLIWSNRGGASGPWVGAKSVEHPGTEARNFDKAIARNRRRDFNKRMQKAMAKGATKSGHRI